MNGTGHLFYEKTSRYDLRCEFCDVSSIDPRATQPCQRASSRDDVKPSEEVEKPYSREEFEPALDRLIELTQSATTLNNGIGYRVGDHEKTASVEREASRIRTRLLATARATLEDKDRLDWLESRIAEGAWSVGNSVLGGFYVSPGVVPGRTYGPTLRAAIDAALSATRSGLAATEEQS